MFDVLHAFWSEGGIEQDFLAPYAASDGRFIRVHDDIPPLADQTDKFRGRHRPGEQEALSCGATAFRRDHPRQLPVEQSQCLAPGRDQRAQVRQAVAGIADLAVQRVAESYQLAQPYAGLEQRAHEAQPLQRLGIVEAVAAGLSRPRST